MGGCFKSQGLAFLGHFPLIKLFGFVVHSDGKVSGFRIRPGKVLVTILNIAHSFLFTIADLL